MTHMSPCRVASPSTCRCKSWHRPRIVLGIALFLSIWFHSTCGRPCSRGGSLLTLPCIFPIHHPLPSAHRHFSREYRKSSKVRDLSRISQWIPSHDVLLFLLLGGKTYRVLSVHNFRCRGCRDTHWSNPSSRHLPLPGSNLSCDRSSRSTSLVQSCIFLGL